MRSKIISVFTIIALLVCTLCSCAVTQINKSDKLTVVCSIFAPFDFARQIVKDKADIIMLLPTGVESHSYEPTPADIITLENADVFFYVSKNTETWVPKLVQAADRKNIKSVEIAEEIGIELHNHEHEHESHEYETDEHIWTNLETSARMVEFMANYLSEIDSNNSTFYLKNANEYIAEILNLRNKFSELISHSRRKEIVSGSRFAMKNFTEEFGLEYTAAFDSCVDNTEPSAAVMSKIIDKINSDNIPVIFYEELTEPKIARAISTETNTRMLLLHSCHNVGTNELKSGATYVSLMEQNYNNLKEALS